MTTAIAIVIATAVVAVALIAAAVYMSIWESRNTFAAEVGYAYVKEKCITDLKNIAHRLRQEMSDPMLPGYARQNYAEIVQAVNALDASRKSEE